MPVRKTARPSANPNDSPEDSPGEETFVSRFNIVDQGKSETPPPANEAYDEPPTAFYEQTPQASPYEAPPQQPYTPPPPPPVTPPPAQGAATSTPSPTPAPPASTPILSGSDILRTAARATIWCGVALLFHGIFCVFR